METSPLPTDDPLFPELSQRVLSGDCVAFLGAGMSRPEYPDWQELIAALCLKCGIKLLEDPQGKRYSAPKLAQMARDANKVEYFNTIKDLFAPRDPTHRHYLLANIPFDSYLTTNYDHLLRKALSTRRSSAIPCFSTYPHLYVLHVMPGDILFLHGNIDPTSTVIEPSIVLTEEEYLAAYQSSALPSFLQQFLPLKTVCFLGCSLQDESLQRIFQWCKTHRAGIRHAGHPSDARWFVLLDKDDPTSAPWTDCGVEIVRYSKVTESYNGLTAILNYWANLPPVELRRLGSKGPISYTTDAEPSR